MRWNPSDENLCRRIASEIPASARRMNVGTNRSRTTAADASTTSTAVTAVQKRSCA
jgi:hypothetical protein